MNSSKDQAPLEEGELSLHCNNDGDIVTAWSYIFRTRTHAPLLTAMQSFHVIPEKNSGDAQLL